MIGPESQAGTIRYGMAAVAAAAQATIPWAVIQVHKGFGVATAAHYAPEPTYCLAVCGVWNKPIEAALPCVSPRDRCRPDPEAKRRAGRALARGAFAVSRADLCGA